MVDLDADRHERRLEAEGAVASQLLGPGDDAPVDAGAILVDPGIGRQDEHDLGRVALETERGKGDRRRRVAPERLGDHVHARQLLADHRPVPPLGDDRDVLGPKIQLRVTDDPLGRELEQGSIAEEGQEGLGGLGSAEGPQPGPAAAGHDHRVHGRSACIAGNPIGAGLGVAPRACSSRMAPRGALGVAPSAQRHDSGESGPNPSRILALVASGRFRLLLTRPTLRWVSSGRIVPALADLPREIAQNDGGVMQNRTRATPGPGLVLRCGTREEWVIASPTSRR